MQKIENRENSEMFNQIAGSYDFLNHLLSLNFDKFWRGKAIRSLAACKPKSILDIATGTADMAIGAAKLHPDVIIGLDASEGMLAIGRKKVLDRGLADTISLIMGTCENLPFEPSSFDAALVAFGVRNFTDPNLGIREIFRVLKPNGKLVVLEFSLPEKTWLRNLYRFYFHKILPVIGKWFSHDLSAYRYLPDSVEAFPKGQAFVDMLNQAGFCNSTYKPLTFGICGLYSGIKKQ